MPVNAIYSKPEGDVKITCDYSKDNQISTNEKNPYFALEQEVHQLQQLVNSLLTKVGRKDGSE